MQKFELILKNEKRKFYDRFAIFIFILNGIAVCIVLARSNYQQLSQGEFPGLVMLALTLFIVAMLIFNPVKQKKYSFLIASIGIVLYWLLLGYWWIGSIMFGLLGLYIISKRQLKVIIENDHIVYPAFPKRMLNWNEVNNLVLKDSLLTIDFKNNRIIQQYIEETSHSVNEKEFNEFCRQQLKK